MSNLKIYKLKSKRLKGAIYLSYHNGIFRSLELDCQLDNEQHAYLLNRIPYNVEQVQLLTQAKLEVKELVTKSVKDKCILFCQAHYKHRGVSYVCTSFERANVKNVPVTLEYLEVFFGSSLENFTLGNYIKRMNIIRDQAKNGKNTLRLPNEWVPDFARKLDGPGYQAYVRYLKKLGLTKHYSPTSGEYWK